MDLSVIELKAKMDQGDQFVFIDVRESYEYDEFNLGARLMPLGELMSQLEDVSDDKNAEIIVHCRSGQRSAMAKGLLLQSGYTKVRNLLGGILAWQEIYGNNKS
jgi:rhodanese-related sulfurtransferase